MYAVQTQSTDSIFIFLFLANCRALTVQSIFHRLIFVAVLI